MQALARIVQQAAEASLTEEVVSAFCQQQGITRDEFLDLFSAHVARGFLSGPLRFEFCNSAMNELPGFTRYELPAFAWSVYDAFDAGEYRHTGDFDSDDPVEKYTRPAVRQLLEQRDGTSPSFGT